MKISLLDRLIDLLTLEGDCSLYLSNNPQIALDLEKETFIENEYAEVSATYGFTVEQLKTATAVYLLAMFDEGMINGETQTESLTQAIIDGKIARKLSPETSGNNEQPCKDC